MAAPPAATPPVVTIPWPRPAETKGTTRRAAGTTTRTTNTRTRTREIATTLPRWLSLGTAASRMPSRTAAPLRSKMSTPGECRQRHRRRRYDRLTHSDLLRAAALQAGAGQVSAGAGSRARHDASRQGGRRHYVAEYWDRHDEQRRGDPGGLAAGIASIAARRRYEGVRIIGKGTQSEEVGSRGPMGPRDQCLERKRTPRVVAGDAMRRSSSCAR